MTAQGRDEFDEALEHNNNSKLEEGSIGPPPTSEALCNDNGSEQTDEFQQPQSTNCTQHNCKLTCMEHSDLRSDVPQNCHKPLSKHCSLPPDFKVNPAALQS